MQRRHRMLRGLALCRRIAALACAQAWPSKPIRTSCRSRPGGTTDILARTIAEKLSIALGQPVIVENKPGAGGGVGAAEVAQSAGRRLHDHGRHDQHARDQRDRSTRICRYDPVRDFVPITLIARVPNMLVVNNDVPAKNVAELIALHEGQSGQVERSRPAATARRSTCPASCSRAWRAWTCSTFRTRAARPRWPTSMGGQVAMTFDNITTAWPLAKGGKLRALAVTTAKRSPVAPDVPTLAEVGARRLRGRLVAGRVRAGRHAARDRASASTPRS